MANSSAAHGHRLRSRGRRRIRPVFLRVSARVPPFARERGAPSARPPPVDLAPLQCSITGAGPPHGAFPLAHELLHPQLIVVSARRFLPSRKRGAIRCDLGDPIITANVACTLEPVLERAERSGARMCGTYGVRATVYACAPCCRRRGSNRAPTTNASSGSVSKISAASFRASQSSI